MRMSEIEKEIRGGADPAKPPSLLAVSGATVDFLEGDHRQSVLKDAFLEVSSGEAVGIVGESGSGKTTMALTILRLLPANAKIVRGEIFWRGRDLAAFSEKELTGIRGREIGMILQSPRSSLSPIFRVGTQFRRLLQLRLGVTRSEAWRIAGDGLEAVGLRDVDRVMSLFPSQLSGGMAQRVLISMSLALQPKLLIADEPTSALDAVSKREILDLLAQLRSDNDFSLLIISHDLEAIARACSRAYVLEGGQVVENGKVENIFDDPQHPYTKRLVAATK